MKLLKATVLSLSLLPAPAYATGISPLMSPAKISDEQKLCEGKHKFSSNHVPHFSKMVKKIAWYQDRDNSMKDIDINEDSIDGKVGRAMATVFSLSGSVSQAIQVCSGVYLATAHGVLDDPKKANQQNRELRAPIKHFLGAYPYPLGDNNYMLPSSNDDFFSPRLRDQKKWGDKSADYVFIKVEKPLRSDDFIMPLIASPRQIEKFRNEMPIFLYRGNTLYEQTGNSINFDKYLKPDFEKLKFFYKRPQKIKHPCKTINFGEQKRSSTNCPFEKRVSGSSLITMINKNPYVLGVAMSARLLNINSFTFSIERPGDIRGSIFINSNSFCQDYLLACGRPCVTLEEALKEE